jgi:hypothetical protein
VKVGIAREVRFVPAHVSHGFLRGTADVTGDRIDERPSMALEQALHVYGEAMARI